MPLNTYACECNALWKICSLITKRACSTGDSKLREKGREEEKEL